jgi:hypothetical protein
MTPDSEFLAVEFLGNGGNRLVAVLLFAGGEFGWELIVDGKYCFLLEVDLVENRGNNFNIIL